jgi:hypothetical protein
MALDLQLKLVLMLGVSSSGDASVAVSHLHSVYCPHRSDADALRKLLPSLPRHRTISALCTRIRDFLVARPITLAYPGVPEEQRFDAGTLDVLREQILRARAAPKVQHELGKSFGAGLSESQSWRLSEGATRVFPGAPISVTPSSAHVAEPTVLLDGSPSDVHAGQVLAALCDNVKTGRSCGVEGGAKQVGQDCGGVNNAAWVGL